MQATLPKIQLASDPEGVMARHGGIVGWNARRVIWGFGFLPNSDSAKAFGVSVPQRTFVMATYGGQIRKTWTGDRKDLPKAFANVIKDKIFFGKDDPAQADQGL